MNSKQFLLLDSLAAIAAIAASDRPSFANVCAVLNKQPEHKLHTILPKTASIQESIYLAINNLNTGPRCLCGSALRFKSIGQGFSTYCSLSCRDSDPSVKIKRENTNLLKFGCKNAGQNKEIKNKIISTNVERCGHNSVLSNPDVIAASKLTRKKIQEEITKRVIATNIERYGVPCTLNDDTIREKARKTLLSRYGVEHNSQIPEVKEKKREQLFSYRKKSQFEEDVVQFIISLGYTGEIIRNSRSIINPMEIDIWFPALNLGIECNGCYWHSDPWKPKDYHKVKTDSVEAIGGKLIQLLDFEWIHKRHIVEHRLKSALGIGERIFARKCELRKISLKEANELIALVHIQGPALAKINYGLYYNDILVAAMNFSKPRFSKKYEYELIRYASTANVIGGASKLLKAFLKEYKPESLITYADRRWSNGNLYQKIGFTKVNITSPGYWYFKGDKFKHRAVFQKHKLKQLLPIFNEELGEVENMYANGWRRIFDSGNFVFEIRA